MAKKPSILKDLLPLDERLAELRKNFAADIALVESGKDAAEEGAISAEDYVDAIKFVLSIHEKVQEWIETLVGKEARIAAIGLQVIAKQLEIASLHFASWDCEPFSCSVILHNFINNLMASARAEGLVLTRAEFRAVAEQYSNVAQQAEDMDRKSTVTLYDVFGRPLFKKQ